MWSLQRLTPMLPIHPVGAEHDAPHCTLPPSAVAVLDGDQGRRLPSDIVAGQCIHGGVPVRQFRNGEERTDLQTVTASPKAD
jgi:hypothetical protein